MPVPDTATAPLMVALHAHLRAGACPAEALAFAARGQDPAAVAAFICVGCDDAAPPLGTDAVPFSVALSATSGAQRNTER
jgi:hypothetical protein